ncbi:hypothetical protein JQC72_08425 [Polycladomyces sp. WAk]|uniref:Nucleotide-diphospho-sugar transferase domain-containing protein n=1 Tax=Polycladomyces zharkentensis TaxID=2807616 RepID=A0ABS2WJ64_9BACL|nr:hypothetical protein [Polycladomyces sp. WAk]MBN2909551.1 hypothetical protein [Polycladomyces sp. WAk]
MAMVMARSAKAHHPDARVAVCIVEEQVPLAAQNFQHFDHIVLAKDLGHPDFYRHMFKSTVHEGVWSLKSRLLQYVLRTFPEDSKFVYLDTDTKIYDPFQEVTKLLDQRPIVLTPNITQPSVFHERSMSLPGLYNSGFLALKRSGETNRFLHWWAERLDQLCYVDVKRGIGGDQKWLDHAPVFFDIHILKHPGYNVAVWNSYYRRIHRTNNGKILVNGQPLRFYHFSRFDKVVYQTFYKNIYPDPRHPIYHLFDQYSRELLEVGYNPSRTLPCSYDHFQSGEPIDMRARLAFRNHSERFAQIQNPFAMCNRTFLGHVENPPRKRKEIPAVKKRKLVGRKRNPAVKRKS